MNSKKPRNRENRTRSIPAEATVTVHMLLPRSAYEEMRQLLSEHRLSKADILNTPNPPTSKQKQG